MPDIHREAPEALPSLAFTPILDQHAKLTTINILAHNRLLRALIHILNTLRLRPTRRTINITRRIKNVLQHIVFPAEDIVGVVGVSGSIAERPDEGLGAVEWPVGRVVELACVPDYFEHYLGGADAERGLVSQRELGRKNQEGLRMRSRAGSCALECPGLWIAHMRHMIRTIQIDTVPTSREAE